MESVTLSSAVRRNLLTMQSTADMMSKTQTRLATGKKVNSALDNPTNFFTASALNSRSSDMMRLQDSIGNAVQTIEAADNGIKAITKLVESAQGTARQALQAPKQITTVTGTSNVASSASSDLRTAQAGGDSGFNDMGIVGAGSININVGGNDYLLNLTGTETMFDVYLSFDALNIPLVEPDISEDNGTPPRYSFDIKNISGDDVTITSISGTAFDDLGMASSIPSGQESIGHLFQTGAIGSETDQLAKKYSPGDLTFDVDGTVSNISLTGNETPQEISNLISNVDGLNASLEPGTLTGSFQLKIEADSDVTNFTTSGAFAVALGLDGAPDIPYANGATAKPNEIRTNLESEYNNLLKQIDQLINDAGFNGNNLLTGDSLKVIFNESGTSSLTLGPQDISSSGIGLDVEATGNFQDNAKVETTLKNLDSAIAKLRSSSSTLGSNLSTVQARKDFTNSMINTLETGAANLILANINQEGANMLALQTRQQLSTTALTMASQEDQAVLRLF